MFGIDFAGVDDNTVDFNKVKAGGKTFVFLRATYGKTVDKDFGNFWPAARQAGIIRGAYHFLRHSQDPEQQAEAFLNTVDLAAGDLAPVLDVEEDRDKILPTLDMVGTWLSVVSARLHELAGKSLQPMIYTSNRIWKTFGHTAGFEAFPLWVVDWNNFDKPTTPVTWGAGQWTFHQYAGDTKGITGINGQADPDKFHALKIGDQGLRVQQLKALLDAAGFGGALSDDGTFDDKMRDAVLSFQQDRGLTQDGVVGPKTFSQLGWP